MISRREIQVRTYECDIYQHVNNANYLHYLEHGRRGFMEDTGFDFPGLTAAGYGLFVTRVDIRYRRPALPDDYLTIETWPVKKRKIGGTMGQRILRGQEVLCEAEVSWASVNPQGRPCPLPPEWDTAGFEP